MHQKLIAPSNLLMKAISREASAITAIRSREIRKARKSSGTRADVNRTIARELIVGNYLGEARRYTYQRRLYY